jgi:hypothetical protein
MLPDDYIRKMKQDLAEVEAMVESKEGIRDRHLPNGLQDILASSARPCRPAYS